MESKIKEVKTEIERLLTKIQEWEDAQGTSNRGFPLFTSKQNGAVKRASMDLTRALANLRRSK